MKTILALEGMGYFFQVKDGKISYVHIGSPIDPEQARPLLEQIRAAKAEAITYLQTRPFTKQSKQRVVFPAKSGLPFPEGSWQRLEDGRIEALVSYSDLKNMKVIRDVIAGKDEGELDAAA